jgi:hypothetical protein|tara:strand:- start:1824 stop:2693 length:870 start_codon:yes stop_codon:yes gene_type:complete
MSKTCIIWLINKIDKICKATGENRLIMAKNSVKNITQHIKLPVIIFHEDFTEEVKSDFLNIYENITFCSVDFQNNNLPFDKNVSKCGKGYMMMCRFFSGVMQSMDILKDYDSYIRMDDDSFLIEPFINQERFLSEANKSYYTYRTIFYDNIEDINNPIGLYNFTYNFCKSYKLDIDGLLPKLKELGFLNNGKYTGICPYNNFHFSKLDLWKNSIIKNYTERIINMNGTLLYNWMDANVHAMIIFVLCPLLYIPTQEITDFGYRHNKHFSILNSNRHTFKQNEDFYPKII